MPLDPELYGAFLVVALAAILSPGPDTLLVIRATLGGGHGHGFAALLGVQIGLLGIWRRRYSAFRWCFWRCRWH
jgi:threonine/homoserine/homoserine lactone efflux protein